MPVPHPEVVITGKWITHDGAYLRTCRESAYPSPWTPPIVTDGWAITLVQNGAYRRRVDGMEHMVDATAGFLRGPGQEVSVATFTAGYGEFTTVLIRPPSCTTYRISPPAGA
jgi:hypothetical protein